MLNQNLSDYCRSRQQQQWLQTIIAIGRDPKNSTISNPIIGGLNGNLDLSCLLFAPTKPFAWCRRVCYIEQALEFIRDDELVAVTPKSVRLRRKVLKADQR